MLNNWQLDVAQFLKDLEIDNSREEIADCLYKVFEELQYIDEATHVDQETRKGYVLLNKLIFTILKSDLTHGVFLTKH
jgi:hypothetical protein